MNEAQALGSCYMSDVRTSGIVLYARCTVCGIVLYERRTASGIVLHKRRMTTGVMLYNRHTTASYHVVWTKHDLWYRVV